MRVLITLSSLTLLEEPDACFALGGIVTGSESVWRSISKMKVFREFSDLTKSLVGRVPSGCREWVADFTWPIYLSDVHCAFACCCASLSLYGTLQILESNLPCQKRHSRLEFLARAARCLLTTLKYSFKQSSWNKSLEWLTAPQNW